MKKNKTLNKRKYKKKTIKRKKIIGGNNVFENKIKKIFQYITISNDKPRDYLRISNCFNNLKKQEGGTLTYNLTSIQERLLSSERLARLFEFDQNSDTIDSTKANVLIFGGGPVGLYMSILIKKIYSHLDLNVYVLEKRHANHKRKLERVPVLALDKLTMDSFWEAYEKNMKPGRDFYPIKTKKEYNDEEFSFVPENVKPLFLNTEGDEFSFLKFIGLDDETLPINILEYKLAKFAQTCGVIILHTGEITMKNMNGYINNNTKLLFDATGGSLKKITFENEKKYSEKYYTFSGKNMVKSEDRSNLIHLNDQNFIVRSKYGDVFYTTDDSLKNDDIYKFNWGEMNLDNKSTNSFQIKTGNLLPEQAITKIGEVYLISIGDSYMKTDFHNGCGIYYAFMISVLIALEIESQFM